jgi:pyridoxal phosphate enzyme (YggS family)
VGETLKARLDEVRRRIAEAAQRTNRKPEEIKLLPVSKMHPVEILREAIAVGINCFGENKVQEAEDKIAELGRDGLEWHLIGHLQANKARKAVKLFDVLHSLDSIELAERLERICKEEERAELRVLVQVDLAGEETKSGIPESELPQLIEFLQGCRYLKFEGLMIVPPYFENAEDVRPSFRRLREIRDKLNGEKVFANGTGELSMGMTHDLEIAIEEGATMIRVGTAIFGERGHAGRRLKLLCLLKSILLSGR